MMKRVCIYWTCDKPHRQRICQRFRLPDHVTIAGETTGFVAEADWSVLQECERRKFLVIRNK